METFLKNNKVLVPIIIAIVSLLISWGIWVTNASFSRTLTDKDIQSVTKSVEELKGDFKIFKRDVDTKFDTMQDRFDKKQDKMMGILLRMEKEENK